MQFINLVLQPLDTVQDFRQRAVLPVKSLSAQGTRHNSPPSLALEKAMQCGLLGWLRFTIVALELELLAGTTFRSLLVTSLFSASASIAGLCPVSKRCLRRSIENLTCAAIAPLSFLICPAVVVSAELDDWAVDGPLILSRITSVIGTSSRLRFKGMKGIGCSMLPDNSLAYPRETLR